MQLLKELYRSIRKTICCFKLIYRASIRYQQPNYYIEEIHGSDLTVYIRCHGIRTLIKTDIESIINDAALLNGLSPSQACLLGGWFGRALRASSEKGKLFKKAKGGPLSLRDNTGRYRIICENQAGEICYLDKVSKQKFIEHPLAIVMNKKLIACFDPSQACYIGILAGISAEKGMFLNVGADKVVAGKSFNHAPKLHLVRGCK